MSKRVIQSIVLLFVLFGITSAQAQVGKPIPPNSAKRPLPPPPCPEDPYSFKGTEIECERCERLAMVDFLINIPGMEKLAAVVRIGALREAILKNPAIPEAEKQKRTNALWQPGRDREVDEILLGNFGAPEESVLEEICANPDKVAKMRGKQSLIAQWRYACERLKN